MSPMDVHIASASLDGNILTLDFSVSGTIPWKGAEIYAILADDKTSSNLLRGENSGRTLSHVSVAWTITRVANLQAATELTIRLPLAGYIQQSSHLGRHLILFAQAPGFGQVLGVDTLSLSGSGERRSGELIAGEQMSKSERYSDTNLAYFMLRATLGLNICIHGVSRILQGPGVFANSLVGSFHKTPLPDWSVHLFGLGLPWVEMLLGGLVLFGLSLRLALFGGAFLIFLLTLGSSLLQDWNAAGLQLIYAMIYAGLLAFRAKDCLSVDSLRRIADLSSATESSLPSAEER